MKLRNILSLMVILSLFFFLGCSSENPVNPSDARNNGANGAGGDVIFSSRTVNANSDEGEEHVKFKWGEHTGELQYLDISVEYLDYFYNDAEGYPVYYIGYPMRYKITIQNSGNRNFGHLEIIAIQEYYEDQLPSYRPWYAPFEVNIHKGDAMPGDSIQVWEDVYLGPYETIVLEDTFIAPWETCAGLDQTHLIIKHYNEGVLHAAVMYDNPELGVYCPPPPEN